MSGWNAYHLGAFEVRNAVSQEDPMDICGRCGIELYSIYYIISYLWVQSTGSVIYRLIVSLRHSVILGLGFLEGGRRQCNLGSSVS